MPIPGPVAAAHQSQGAARQRLRVAFDTERHAGGREVARGRAQGHAFVVPLALEARDPPPRRAVPFFFAKETVGFLIARVEVSVGAVERRVRRRLEILLRRARRRFVDTNGDARRVHRGARNAAAVAPRDQGETRARRVQRDAPRTTTGHERRRMRVTLAKTRRRVFCAKHRGESPDERGVQTREDAFAQRREGRGALSRVAARHEREPRAVRHRRRDFLKTFLFFVRWRRERKRKRRERLRGSVRLRRGARDRFLAHLQRLERRVDGEAAFVVATRRERGANAANRRDDAIVVAFVSLVIRVGPARAERERRRGERDGDVFRRLFSRARKGLFFCVAREARELAGHGGKRKVRLGVEERVVVGVVVALAGPGTGPGPVVRGVGRRPRRDGRARSG